MSKRSAGKGCTIVFGSWEERDVVIRLIKQEASLRRDTLTLGLILEHKIEIKWSPMDQEWVILLPEFLWARDTNLRRGVLRVVRRAKMLAKEKS